MFTAKKPVKVFRVQFTIDGDNYSVFPLRGVHPEVAVRAYRFKKHAGVGKPPASTYDVKLDTDGRATCECKGFLCWGHCRHNKTLVAFGRFPPDAWEVEEIDPCPPLPARQEPQTQVLDTKAAKVQRARDLIAQGMSKKAAAKELGVPESTLRTWLRKAAG